MTEGGSKLEIECIGWKPLERNTLKGFADFRIRALRLVIRECTIHQSGDRQWVALPGKPQINKDGQVVKRDGKAQYSTILAWDTKAVADAFSAAALQALDRFQWANGHGKAA